MTKKTDAVAVGFAGVVAACWIILMIIIFGFIIWMFI